MEEEFELRNKRPWQGKKSYIANFTVRMIIAPADLKFELWFNGKRYNRGHDPLLIAWDQVGASARPPSCDGAQRLQQMAGKVITPSRLGEIPDQSVSADSFQGSGTGSNGTFQSFLSELIPIDSHYFVTTSINYTF